jgi:phosphoribosylcarboxyaminoimidazole (NCAIR) mutase
LGHHQTEIIQITNILEFENATTAHRHDKLLAGLLSEAKGENLKMMILAVSGFDSAHLLATK